MRFRLGADAPQQAGWGLDQRLAGAGQQNVDRSQSERMSVASIWRSQGETKGGANQLGCLPIAPTCCYHPQSIRRIGVRPQIAKQHAAIRKPSCCSLLL